MSEWWRTFFDEHYVSLWGPLQPPEVTEEEADGIWKVLGLAAGVRVLDAPCGYGRISLALAKRGAVVVGVDQSEALLAEAERRRGDVGPDRLRYLRQDLRAPLAEGGFDVALNVFTSLGYGSDEDDVAILKTLAGAVRPGGLVFVETSHRDLLVTRGASESRGVRLDDGTIIVETPRFDPVAGRMETAWHWSGPNGSGSKPASLRVYCATEIAALVTRAGLRVRSAHAGASEAPFQATKTRLGLLAEKA